MRTEKWLEGIFRGEHEAAKRYMALGARELPVVAVAVVDAALAEFLGRRLLNDAAEQSSFLGTNGDGRAPAASVGAKIQLAYLTGLLRKEDVKALRILKGIRNMFAHKVTLDYRSPVIVKELIALEQAWVLAFAPTDSAYKPLFPEVGENEEVGRLVIMAVALYYEIRFRDRIGKVQPLEYLDDSA